MNTQIQDIKKILRITTIILVGFTLLTPFVFSGNMFFPFITSKAFFMRTMIALASVSYIFLALLDKDYRPKKSMLMYAVFSFIGVLVLATLNSVDPVKSFWSNFERMEGLLTMIYMSVLFIISASAIKKNEWTYLMNTSLIISIIVGLEALGGTEARIVGNLGNSSYLGVYALIHIFFGGLGALMIFRGNREKELLESGEHKATSKINTRGVLYIILFVLAAIFNAYILYKTGTRGAFVGLVVGLILSSLYFVWKEKNKVIKYAALGFLSAVVVSVVLLGMFKHSAVVKNSSQLNRFAELITTDYKSVLNNQGYARTMIWKMAFEGVKERPILGWGQDNFGYVFTKYYNPHMYGQEQWFDRSHNVFMDWLIAGGLLGLIGYLSLFVFAIYFIFSKKSKFTIVEQSMLIGLLAAYFIHNIFVFDNLSSYVLFFLVLAFIHDRYTHDRNEKKSEKNLTEEEKNKIILFGFISVLLIVFISYQTILKPFSQNKSLINILQGLKPETVSVTIQSMDKDFKNAFDTSDNGKIEVFEQLSMILPKVLSIQSVPDTTKQNIYNTYEYMVKNLEPRLKDDSRFNFFLSNTYKGIGDKERALFYINRAYALSPQKQSFTYNKALILIDQNDIDNVIALLEKAYNDAPENETAYGYYLGTLIEYKIEDTDKITNVAIEGFKKNKHDLIFKKEFWSIIKNKQAKKVIAEKIIKEIPQSKDIINNLSK